MVRKVKNDSAAHEPGPAPVSANRRHTKISAKHQVTIPAAAFEVAGLAAGDRLKAKPVGVGKVLLERVESSIGRYAGALTGVWDKEEVDHLRDEWD